MASLLERTRLALGLTKKQAPNELKLADLVSRGLPAESVTRLIEQGIPTATFFGRSSQGEPFNDALQAKRDFLRRSPTASSVLHAFWPSHRSFSMARGARYSGCPRKNAASMMHGRSTCSSPTPARSSSKTRFCRRTTATSAKCASGAFQSIRP